MRKNVADMTLTELKAAAYDAQVTLKIVEREMIARVKNGKIADEEKKQDDMPELPKGENI
jgi:hypothetical protein